jgi:membrane-bound serine protease (ClpP class)
MAKPTTGGEGLLGETGIVRSAIDRTGYIYLAGELWEASADETIEEGAEVVVIEVDNLKVKVKRKS